MAPLMYFSSRKALLLYVILFLFTSVLLCASSDNHHLKLERQEMIGRRRRMLLELEEEVELKPKKIKTSSYLSTKNQTKLIKPNNSSLKNQTNLIKSNSSLKNQTKLIKPTLSSENQTKLAKPTISTKSKPINTSDTLVSKTELKKLNSTSKIKLKKLNSTSLLKKLDSTTSTSKSTNYTKLKTSDLLQLDSTKNKTTTNQIKSTKATPQKPNPKKTTSQKQPPGLVQDDNDGLVAEFRDLPIKFQNTLVPDLEKISLASKKYLTKANKEMIQGFKPYVGNKYAPTIASFVSFAFILIPLLLVSLLFNRIKAHFSLQKVLIFIQVYLSIYFSILCLSSLVTGLEPLGFFFATSRSTYVCVMVLQTLAYVLYLLMLLMYLVLVFSTECGLGSKLLGLVQTFVGFAVGLHFYVAVFHEVVLHQPPKTNWKIHGIYAACFLAICLLATAERRKKAYLEDGGEEGKKN